MDSYFAEMKKRHAWWRGYSDADLESVKRKIAEGAPGAIINVTAREIAALNALRTTC